MNQNDLEEQIRDFVEQLQVEHGFSTRMAAEALETMAGEFEDLARDEE